MLEMQVKLCIVPGTLQTGNCRFSEKCRVQKLPRTSPTKVSHLSLLYSKFAFAFVRIIGVCN